MVPRDTSSPGAPCWVQTFQLDPRAATEFYGPLFGWSFDETDIAAGQFGTARLDGRSVAGIAHAPFAAAVGWLTFVRADDLESTLSAAQRAGGTCISEPVVVGPGVTIALVTDDLGIPFGLATGLVADVADEPCTWAMSSLHTPDVERSARFYRSVFGWDYAEIPGAGFAEFRLRGQRVGLATPTAGAVPPHWSVNFAVTDADATAERAVSLGGSLLLPPTDTPGFRSAVIQDPQGGVVAVSAPR